MNTFVSGGCKNGKSMFAQNLAKKIASEKSVPLYYLATMIRVDEEDDARIARHRAERAGWGFDTLEQGTDICACLENPAIDQRGVFLVDSVTALLMNEMFSGEQPDFEAKERTANQLCEFARRTGNCVFVSDFLYGEADKYDDITEKYRQALAYIDKKLANVCENVVEYSYGIPFYYKKEGI